MPANLEWYHKKEESNPVVLTPEEERDKAEDREDIMNQRKYRDQKKDLWRWAGSVYNIVQGAQASDEISNITLGWIRSYIDTGVSQTTNGMPEFDYEAFGPTDYTKEKLWSKMVETGLQNSFFLSHLKTAVTDAHIFGPGVLEVYQGTQYRTLRVPQEDGTYKEKVVVDMRPGANRWGVRAVSPFRVTRNPDITGPDLVGSCSKEEYLPWNQFVVEYGRARNDKGELKYKNLDMIQRGSHVMVTKYQDENRDVYRIYALSYGNESDGKAQSPNPTDLGIPIFDRPLKIHDIKDKKGEILRSMGLNMPGMCNLVFLPYIDKLDTDYETHSILGAGLPEHMEGLDTFMQTAFNMTVDNFRLGNTVVIGVESRDGTTPDFDANTYYGGEFVNANITSSTLGQDRTANFKQMYEQIQSLAIPGTGININQITGDTSQTAFEFAQRIKANSERAETILRGWENGPLKRLGSLALSASLTEMTTYDVEQLTGKEAEKVMDNIGAGRATRDDFEFENGKPVSRKNRFSINMEGLREDFSNNKSRSFNVDSANNTLILDDSGKENKIPLDKEYVYPDWFIESGVPFDVKVRSKRMLTNKHIQDVTTMQVMFQTALQGMQIDPAFANNFDFSKFFNEISARSDFDMDAFMKDSGDDQISKLREMIAQAEPNPQSDEQAIPKPSQVPELSAITPGVEAPAKSTSLQQVSQGAL